MNEYLTANNIKQAIDIIRELSESYNIEMIKAAIELAKYDAISSLSEPINKVDRSVSDVAMVIDQ